MKLNLWLKAVIFGLSFGVASLAAAAQLDVNSSNLKWVGTKVAGSHNGTLKLKSGNFDLAKGKGNFVIDMNSIDNKDLKGEWKGKLEGHLKSADFFNVGKFPTAKFNLTKAVKKSPTQYTFTGDLTVKNITKPISFPVTVGKKSGKMALSGKFKINRLKWDIKYNSGKFFDVNKLGDKLIYDDIDIELDLLAAN